MKALFVILSLILGIFPFKESGARFGAGEKQVFVVHYKWGVLNADVARVTCECDSIMYRGVPAYKAKIYGKTEKFCEAIVKVREDFLLHNLYFSSALYNTVIQSTANFTRYNSYS